ncbi:hypothetical protein GEMRC1_009112 [Eukaryota sp. GEM-RC1]
MIDSRLLCLSSTIPDAYLVTENSSNIPKLAKCLIRMQTSSPSISTNGFRLKYELQLIDRIIYKARNAHRTWTCFQKLQRIRQLSRKISILDPIALRDSLQAHLQLPSTNVPLTSFPLPTTDALYFTLFKLYHLTYLLSELRLACLLCSEALTRQLQVKHMVHFLLVVLSSISSVRSTIDPVIESLDEVYSKVLAFKKVLASPTTSQFSSYVIRTLSSQPPSNLYKHLLEFDNSRNLFAGFCDFISKRNKLSLQSGDYGEIVD